MNLQAGKVRVCAQLSLVGTPVSRWRDGYQQSSPSFPLGEWAWEIEIGLWHTASISPIRCRSFRGLKLNADYWPTTAVSPSLSLYFLFSQYLLSLRIPLSRECISSLFSKPESSLIDNIQRMYPMYPSSTTAAVAL